MIKIKKSKNADSRTCDWSKVDKKVLLKESKLHIQDVMMGMSYLSTLIKMAGINHDHTKLSHIDNFFDNFKNGFKEGHQDWWEMHQKTERHHLKKEEFIQEDVNLIDILEQIVDGVMAGLARSGKYRQEEISPELLKKAYDNTIKLLLAKVEVEE